MSPHAAYFYSNTTKQRKKKVCRNAVRWSTVGVRFKLFKIYGSLFSFQHFVCKKQKNSQKRNLTDRRSVEVRGDLRRPAVQQHSSFWRVVTQRHTRGLSYLHGDYYGMRASRRSRPTDRRFHDEASALCKPTYGKKKKRNRRSSWWTDKRSRELLEVSNLKVQISAH